MAISQAALQQSILSLLCHDQQTAQILSVKVTPDLFLGRQGRLIAETAINFIRAYGQPPRDQLDYLLENELKRGEEGKLLGQTLDILKRDFATLSSEFILAELNDFEEKQRMTVALQNSLEELDRGDLVKAKEQLGSIALSTRANPDNEIWLTDTAKMFRFLDKQETDFISSGIEAVDKVGARPAKGTVTFLIAPTGKGKSWFLLNVVKAAIQNHHNVLYITLEMDADIAAKRLLQSMFALTATEAKTIKSPIFTVDDKGALTINYQEIKRESIMTQRGRLSKLITDARSWPRVVIKRFPSGQLTVNALDAYLEYLKREKGFVPDVVSLDYAELMKLSADNLRIDIGRLWVALRGNAAERNYALVSASQGNKDSDKAKTVYRSMAAEDWSKVGTADVVYTYSQTPEEQKLGLSRILIAKSRDSEDRIMILNAQSYQTGQFSIDSVLMSRDVTEQLDQLTGGQSS